MNAKFIKKGNKTYFQDQYGAIWTEENLSDIIRAVTEKVKSENTFKYYDQRLVNNH